jgi:hypothetical protein
MADSPSAPLFSTEDPAVAEAIVAWLSAQDIPAETRDGDHTDSTGLAAMTESLSVKEVWLKDESHRERALQVVEQQAKRLHEHREEGPEYEIALTCEKCGRQMVFSSKLRGTVQECPECAEYVDIPDEGDDDFDYGQPEDEENP